MKKLSDKQQRFADEYLVDLNATRAYLRAGYRVSEPVAAVNAKRLLENESVAGYVAARQAELRSATEITQERVLREYARIAFFSENRLHNDDGTLKDPGTLDDDTSACIAGLEFDAAGNVRKYRFADKKGALDSLAKYLGLYKEPVEHSGSVEMRRSELGKILEQLRGPDSG